MLRLPRIHQDHCEALAGEQVDRTEFDMNWNMPLPNGEPALGNTVTLKAELTLVAQEA